MIQFDCRRKAHRERRVGFPSVKAILLLVSDFSELRLARPRRRSGAGRPPQSKLFAFGLSGGADGRSRAPGAPPPLARGGQRLIFFNPLSAEQLFLEPELVPHHRQARGYLTPGQGGSFLSSRQQRSASDAVFRVKSHVYALEGQDCQYKQMFGAQLRAAVLKLVQVVARARQTAKGIWDRSGQAAANKSFLRWLAGPSSDADEGLCGLDPDESSECLRKTHEFLDRALEHLCAVFKLNRGQLTQLMASAASSQDDGERKRLPDCLMGERGLVLTDLGRMQIINGLRRFDVAYQGDPELQPIRSYESALLVRFLYRISSLLNAKFEGRMAELCSRRDFAGRLGRQYLTEADPGELLARSPVSPGFWERARRPRLSLRPLASYRTILLLALAYGAGAVLSLGPASSTLLILAAVFLRAVLVTLCVDMWKTR